MTLKDVFTESAIMGYLKHEMRHDLQDALLLAIQVWNSRINWYSEFTSAHVLYSKAELQQYLDGVVDTIYRKPNLDRESEECYVFGALVIKCIEDYRKTIIEKYNGIVQYTQDTKFETMLEPHAVTVKMTTDKTLPTYADNEFYRNCIQRDLQKALEKQLYFIYTDEIGHYPENEEDGNSKENTEMEDKA